MPKRQLLMWVIYHNASDYPGEYVARRWKVTRAGARADPAICARAQTLEEVRRQLPAGLYCLQREKEDGRTIVETWL